MNKLSEKAFRKSEMHAEINVLCTAGPYRRHTRNICGPWYFYILRDVVGIFMVFFPLLCMIFHPVEVELRWFITDVLKGRTYLENSHYCHSWYKRYGSNILTKIPRKYLLHPLLGWKSSKTESYWIVVSHKGSNEQCRLGEIFWEGESKIVFNSEICNFISACSC